MNYILIIIVGFAIPLTSKIMDNRSTISRNESVARNVLRETKKKKKKKANFQTYELDRQIHGYRFLLHLYPWILPRVRHGES